MTSPEFDVRPSILVGDTADVAYQRVLTILRNEGLNPMVTVEFSPERDGVLCGVREVQSLLQKILPEAGSEVWSLEEGAQVSAGEVALRIRAPYNSFGLYETAICGILASCSGWAAAARECRDAAGGIPVISEAARHVHPNVAAVIDYAAVVGGCTSCSTALGARLAGVTPQGSMPHALPLIMGDTVAAIQAFHRHIPQAVPRIAIIDTLHDEVDEALSVARSMRGQLRGVRLDTPPERGGVTPELVRELRVRLDMAGFRHVEIYVSGDLTAQRIRAFVDKGAPVNGFAVGSYIANARPNLFRADIREIEETPVARRGRLPGVTENPRLSRVM